MTDNKNTQLSALQDQLSAGRRLYLLNTIKILGFLMLVLVAQRVYFAGFNNTHLTAWASLIAIAALYTAVKNGFSTTISSIIVLLFLIIQLAMLSYRSAGLMGPGIMAAPFIPLLATLLISRLAGWLCVIACSLIIATMAYLNATGYDFKANLLSESRLYVLRGTMLVGIVILINYAAWYYSKISEDMSSTVLRQASKDYLTGIANRGATDNALKMEFKRTSRNGNWLSILMIDIDHFKRYNDNYGHQQGDICLQKVVAELQSSLQRPQDLLGRWGGEEFLLLMPDTDPEGAFHVAGLLAKRVQSLGIKYHPDEDKVVTLSIGVASCRGSNQQDCESLIKKADDALYTGKRQGRNRVISADLETATV